MSSRWCLENMAGECLWTQSARHGLTPQRAPKQCSIHGVWRMPWGSVSRHGLLDTVKKHMETLCTGPNFIHPPPPPPLKYRSRGGGCVKGVGIKVLPRGASKYTPLPPSPGKCLFARNGGGWGAYIISPRIVISFAFGSDFSLLLLLRNSGVPQAFSFEMAGGLFTGLSSECLTPPVANTGAAERPPCVTRVSRLLEIPTDSCHFPCASNTLVRPQHSLAQKGPFQVILGNIQAILGCLGWPDPPQKTSLN